MDVQNALQSCNCKKPHFIIGVFAALFLISITVWFAVGSWDKIKSGVSDMPATITVSGDSDVYAKPDLGIVNLSVVVEKLTVAEAMAEGTKKMNEVVAAVKSLGVEEKDLKTVSFNIYPKYEYQTVQCLVYPCPPGRNVLTGYEVNQQLEVKIRTLDKAGDIIQAATDAGANEVGNLQFTIENEDAVRSQAREEAISEAKAKAKELAGQLGVRLVRITGFNEDGNMPYPIYDSVSLKGMGVGGGESSTPSVETGQNKITVSVTISYEVK